MNHLKLLEDAAKAAGINHVGYTGIDYDGRLGLQVVDSIGRHTDTWNPLDDDGDALRLANKLWLEVRHVHGKAHAGEPQKFWCTEAWFPNGDQNAATRRAIVRAAAEIGRAA